MEHSEAVPQFWTRRQGGWRLWQVLIGAAKSEMIVRVGLGRSLGASKCLEVTRASFYAAGAPATPVVLRDTAGSDAKIEVAKSRQCREQPIQECACALLKSLVSGDAGWIFSESSGVKLRIATRFWHE